ncbi:TetR/AcrR family transcriptional regulator [Dactylosporangium sucinum]|uniref:TetR family transcriptional regulator n=1 Tax=Dactylosporangium sucinum TaxID=1424081 RepID=A0A917T1L4_9ACTN|nr:TetR/AcrR family transcriptional regulator [Dactylosporangium sucinum]GGM06554.1 TetR family transcriptional regulator [Dactylosporangium sucinum]
MGPRERYREQVRDEIRTHAWTQVATAGASALSLNAIAKQMGISGPALYRYFASRDDLITDLVLDAYRDLAETCEAAAAGEDTPAGRLSAAAGAIRAWALAAPHRYLLIYGTPVPGYAAPPEATALASRIMRLLLDGFAPAGDGGPDTGLDRHLDQHRHWAGDDHPAAALSHALRFWTRLHGVLSLEVAGHFTGMAFDPAVLYAAEVASVVPPVSPPGR